MSINENKVDEDISECMEKFGKAKNRLASFICEVRSANAKNICYLAAWSCGYYPRDSMIKSALSKSF